MASAWKGFECNRHITPIDYLGLIYNHPHEGADLKVVTQLPLRELWSGDGFSITARGKSLVHEDVREFLASGPIQFVVAEVD